MRYTTENLKPVGKTRLVRSFQGESSFGWVAAKGCCDFDGLATPRTRALLAFLVVDDLPKKLFLGLLQKTNGFTA
jgi:hypothetical protein